MVNAGYASVSFFILLSGFVLGYNYNAKARAGELSNVRFYEARFTRLYPIYLLSLILAFKMIPLEWGDPHPWNVLDGHGAVSAVAAGVDSRDCDLSEYSGVDDVG